MTKLQYKIAKLLINSLSENLNILCQKNKKTSIAYETLVNNNILDDGKPNTGSAIGSVLYSLNVVLDNEDPAIIFGHFATFKESNHFYREVKQLGSGTVEQSILSWIEEHPGINISHFESQIKCPKGTIQAAVNKTQNRGIPTKYLDKLIEELKKYGY